MQDNQDGWETVTDPREVQKLMGVKGVQQMQKQARSGDQAQSQGRPGQVPNLDAPVSQPTGQGAQQAFAKVAAARAMLKQLNHVRGLYDKNMAATGLGGLREYNPLRRENQQFDGAVAAIPLLGRQAFRVAGSGSDSNQELQVIKDALPSRWGFDATNQERFHTLDRVLRSYVSNYAPLAGYSAEQVEALRRENVYGRLPTPPPRRRLPVATQGWKIIRKQ